MSYLPHVVPAALCIVASVAVAGQHDPRSRKPLTFANAENHLRVQFLPPERDWERVDIYVPKAAKAARLPCVVIFYGGGWNGKVLPKKEELQALLDRGYVVAVPDYCLGAATPVPLTVWDGAHAIRWLRANAAKYRIDPERIGAWGLSAGGWLVQYLAPSDSSTVFALRVKRSKDVVHVPMLEPRPPLAEHSARLQAFVTDWGARRLAEKRPHGYPAWLTSDDPPLHTCHVDPEGKLPPGPALLRAVGVPVTVAFLTNVKNTHVPSPKRSLTTDAEGKQMTYREHIHRFLDEYVKHPKHATAPEFFPQGGPVAGEVEVRIRCVHPDAVIHYTTDGTDPTLTSPRYEGPLVAKPDTVLKAIAVKPGLAPSRVATAVFVAASAPRPVITTRERVFHATKGRPFAARFEARSKLPVRWFVTGKTALVSDRSYNPPRKLPWLQMDPATGVLSGTPDAAGVCPLLIVVNSRDGERVLCDAVRATVVVGE